MLLSLFTKKGDWTVYFEIWLHFELQLFRHESFLPVFRELALETQSVRSNSTTVSYSEMNYNEWAVLPKWKCGFGWLWLETGLDSMSMWADVFDHLSKTRKWWSFTAWRSPSRGSGINFTLGNPFCYSYKKLMAANSCLSLFLWNQSPSFINSKKGPATESNEVRHLLGFESQETT